MDIEIVLLVLWTLVCCSVQAFTEMPKFNQLKLMYPGYPKQGGTQHDSDIIHHVLGSPDKDGDFIPVGNTPLARHPHNTAALRMSWTLNRYSGRHAIGTTPIELSLEGRDSVTGRDGQEYIFRNTAFGPYLAEKYGNPIVAKFDHVFNGNDDAENIDNQQHYNTKTNPKIVLTSLFHGKQGIIRFVSYHKDHAGGHIALWDCDHFFQTRDWSTEHHIIAVEFWESPDSYCPPKSHQPDPAPHMIKPGSTIKLIARHNFQTVTDNELTQAKSDKHQNSQNTHYHHSNAHTRHKLDKRNHRVDKTELKETLWVQEET